MNEHSLIFGGSEMRTRDENKAEAIREKAIRMIAQQGFDGLSMQKLARAAGVSPATIYIFYRNREDLLNSLYNQAQEKFAETALRGFDPEMSLQEGLWLQWKNRFDFIKENPLYFKFIEQFKNSPLVHHKDIRMGEFKNNMRQFFSNAVKKGQLAKMEPETFWALAYAPFYTMVKFHLQKRSMMNDTYELTDAKLKKALNRIVVSLQP